MAIGIVCVAVPLNIKILVVPGVMVPSFGFVIAPLTLNVPAPPDRSITLFPGVSVAALPMVNPANWIVPVVNVIFETRVAVVEVSPTVVRPVTVAVPALTSQLLVMALAGLVIVAVPLTVRSIPLA